MFRSDGTLYRQVNKHYQAEYDKLVQSGLLAELTTKGYLIPAEEVTIPPADADLGVQDIKTG